MNVELMLSRALAANDRGLWHVTIETLFTLKNLVGEGLRPGSHLILRNEPNKGLYFQ
jgi:hypothetical protein